MGERRVLMGTTHSGANPSDPNGYLAYAKAGLNHFEDIAGASFACDETQGNCGRYSYDNFNPYYAYDSVWTAYSMIRSQLSGPEIAAFAGKVLNDLDTSHNGISASSCTKQTISNGTGTITASAGTNVVTGSGTSFTTQLVVGQVLFNVLATNSGQTIGVIYSITDNTHLILTAAPLASSTGSGMNFRFASAWTTGACGLTWMQKHYDGTWDSWWNGSGQAGNFATNYPPSGGQSIGYGQVVGCAQYNICAAADKYGILAGLALADDSADAITMLQQAYTPFINFDVPAAETSFTPLNLGSAGGYVWAWQLIVGGAALAVNQSVLSPPNLIFNWFKNVMAYGTFGGIPNDLSTSVCWGNSQNNYSAFGSWFTSQMMGSYLEDGTAQQQNYYNYIRNVRPDYSAAGWLAGGGQYLAFIYPFYDFNATATSPGNAVRLEGPRPHAGPV